MSGFGHNRHIAADLNVGCHGRYRGLADMPVTRSQGQLVTHQRHGRAFV